MKLLGFSQTGIYYLQHLANLVKERTGVRHKLSNQSDVINLLRYSSTCTDTSIYSSYHEFTDTLNEDKRIYLQSRGILLPQSLIPLQGNWPESKQSLR